jgi:stage II sporulation protein D
MKILVRVLLLLIACMPFTETLQAGIIERMFTTKTERWPPTIKLLLAHDKEGVMLEVKGKYHLYDPYDNSHISTRFIGKRKYIQAISDGIKWGEEFPGVHQLLISPDSQDVTTLIDGIEYRGKVYIYDVGGTISIVNEPDIEDYLESMLTPHFREEFPHEVLAAVAIAARTNAYYEAANPKHTFWALDAREVGYQGYAVTNKEAPIGKAIDATRYLIMSRTPMTDDVATPFMTSWGIGEKPSKVASNLIVVSHISLHQAEDLARKGDHAAKILAVAFPDSHLALMHYKQPPKVVAEQRKAKKPK